MKTINVTEKTGHLVTLKSVNDENDLVIINKSGITLRLHVTDIRVMGRATQGVRLINLDKRGDEIASVCCVDADPDEEVEEIDANAEVLEADESVNDIADDDVVDEIEDDTTEVSDDDI